MANVTMSILGLYNWDDTLFDSLMLPDNVDPEEVRDNILLECSELEALYPSPAFMKSIIGVWSARELPTWNRIAEAAAATFNPIENYDRYEDMTETNDNTKQHSGTDTGSASGYTSNSGTDTVTVDGTTANRGQDTNTHKVAGYDSADTETAAEDETAFGSAVDVDTVTETEYGSGNTHSENSSVSYGHKEQDNGAIHHVSHVHGNIGVTTASQMLKEVIDLAPDLNVVNYIVKSFRDRFCLIVW